MKVSQYLVKLCAVTKLGVFTHESSYYFQRVLAIVNDVTMAARLKEVDLTCQLNECREKLLITEQRVLAIVILSVRPSVRLSVTWVD